MEEEDEVEFDQDVPEDGFFPVEPPFETTAPPDNFDEPENSIEIVEPAPNEPPPEPEPLRPRRSRPPSQFGSSPRSFSRPTPARPSGGSGFGRTANDIQFRTTGKEQSEDTLEQKKETLKSLREEYRQTFGN